MLFYRNRADELQTKNPLLDRVDHTVYSVGWALGALDYPRPRSLHLGNTNDATDDSNMNDNNDNQNINVNTDKDDGGVKGPPQWSWSATFLNPTVALTPSNVSAACWHCRQPLPHFW